MLRAALAHSADWALRMEAEPYYFTALSQHSRIAGFLFCSLGKTKAPATDNKYIMLTSKGLHGAACYKLQQTSTFLSIRDVAEHHDSPCCQCRGEFPGNCKNTGYRLD